MSRLKKVMKGRKGTFLLLGAAVLLLAGSAVGSARAALTYYSENYTAQMEMYDIGVTLVEESVKGSKNISSRDYAGRDDAWKQNQGALLTDMLDETDGKLVAGRNYKEALSVKNSGNIDAFVHRHHGAGAVAGGAVHAPGGREGDDRGHARLFPHHRRGLAH